MYLRFPDPGARRLPMRNFWTKVWSVFAPPDSHACNLLLLDTVAMRTGTPSAPTVFTSLWTLERKP